MRRSERRMFTTQAARLGAVVQAEVARQREYVVWEDLGLPEGKVMIPGVICHAFNVPGRPERVVQRIQRLRGA